MSFSIPMIHRGNNFNTNGVFVPKAVLDDMISTIKFPCNISIYKDYELNELGSDIKVDDFFKVGVAKAIITGDNGYDYAIVCDLDKDVVDKIDIDKLRIAVFHTSIIEIFKGIKIFPYMIYDVVDGFYLINEQSTLLSEHFLSSEVYKEAIRAKYGYNKQL